jgi:hypothetical protein
MKAINAIVVGICLIPGIAAAGGKLGYGSRAGMEVLIISSAGLDTERAVIVTKRSREDAERYCVEYVGKVTTQCVNDQLAVRLNDRVFANCKTGEFIDFYGKHYRFEGPNPDFHDDLSDSSKPFDQAKYIVRDLSDGERADGSSASGYHTNLAIFAALCPMEAPKEQQ